MSKETDIYYTIEEQQDSEIVVKGSRFIGNAFPVDTKEKAHGVLDVIKAKYYDATHNCYAYCIGQLGMEYRFADDGEPSGTAGKPILFMINKFNFKDIIVIVTRYFGGTKLGVGGLSRAYSDSASSVLELCKSKPVYITTRIKVFCAYEDVSALKKLTNEYAVRCEEFYRDSVEFVMDVQVSRIEEFKSILTNVTRGRAGFLG